MRRKPRRTRFAQLRSAKVYLLYMVTLALLLTVSVTLMRTF